MGVIEMREEAKAAKTPNRFLLLSQRWWIRTSVLQGSALPEEWPLNSIWPSSRISWHLVVAWCKDVDDSKPYLFPSIILKLYSLSTHSSCFHLYSVQSLNFHSKNFHFFKWTHDLKYSMFIHRFLIAQVNMPVYCQIPSEIIIFYDFYPLIWVVVYPITVYYMILLAMM